MSYLVRPATLPSRRVSVRNQFGNHLVTARRLHHILVPSPKLLREGPSVPLRVRTGKRIQDFFACYLASGDRQANRRLALIDQFELRAQTLGATALDAVCNPARAETRGKTTPHRHPESHLVSYRLPVVKSFPRRTVLVVNRIGVQTLTTGRPTRILVPSAKRHCARFEADTNVPIRRADASLQQVATITKIRFTPYAGVENGACTTT